MTRNLRRLTGRLQLAVALSAALVAGAIALAGASPAAARPDSCSGTLVPVSGGPANETGYSFSCDFDVSGRYTVAASTSGGQEVPGSLHGAGQGFSCTPQQSEEGSEESEEY